MCSLDFKCTEAILKVACSIINMDVAELWCVRKIDSADGVALRFLQLHTNPQYDDRHGVLVGPEQGTEEKMHCFSPILCRSVCDGGQIVWANSNMERGLTGDLPLNTASAMPLFNVDGELIIAVFFAVATIPLSLSVVEFLSALPSTICAQSKTFLPVSDKSVTIANTEQFFGLWDLNELMRKYYRNISFHLLPMEKIQTFYDIQERDFLEKLLINYKEVAATKWDTTEDPFANLCPFDDSVEKWIQPSTTPHEVSSSSPGFISPLDFQHCAPPPGLSPTERKRAITKRLIDSLSSYRNHHQRFHQFTLGVLGCTEFDSAEIWFQNAEGLLCVAAALRAEKESLSPWLKACKDIQLKVGEGVPGIVMASHQPFWDFKYDDNKELPRAELAKKCGIKTAFGVPLQGRGGPIGALVFYSTKSMEPEPLISAMITKGALILCAASLDQSLVNTFGVESILTTPGSTLSSWVRENKFRGPAKSSPSSRYVPKILPPPIVHVELMGSSRHRQCSRELGYREYGTRSASTSSVGLGNLDSHGSIPPSSSTGSLSSMNSAGVISKFNEKGQRLCRNESCDNICIKRSPYCVNHSGTRYCHYPGCTKCAQGSTKFCIGHGGGRRCTYPGCNKGARDKLFCAAHGGGKRCTFAGCTKSAVGGSKLCTAHGGGKRCRAPGCEKASQSGTMYCVRHGGGRKCKEVSCVKVARGRTDFCAVHSTLLIPEHEHAEHKAPARDLSHSVSTTSKRDVPQADEWGQFDDISETTKRLKKK